MTLIEVLATLVILAILTVLAIPSFARFQGRQNLLASQKGVQSILYRMQQLALAPLEAGQEGYDVVGYGLAVIKSGPNTARLGGCSVGFTRDTFALVSIIKSPSGEIGDYLVDAANAQTGCTQREPIDPKTLPMTFYVLPTGIDLSNDSNPALPWFGVWPLNPVGSQYGQLCQRGCESGSDPFISGNGHLKLKYARLKDISVPANFLCREVTISRNVTIEAKGTIVTGGCT